MNWAIFFAMIAMGAGVLAFGGAAGAVAGVANIVFLGSMFFLGLRLLIARCVTDGWRD